MKQLRYFVEIVDLRSISKAAIRLFVAQSALSQQVSSLEDELGVALFTRSNRGVEPTQAGLVLYRRARQILRQIVETKQELAASAQALSGTVSLGLPTSTAAMLGMPLVHNISEKYPGIRLHLFESFSGFLEEHLSVGRLDLAVLFHTGGVPDFHIDPLLEEELFLCQSSAGNPGRGPVNLGELDGHPLLLSSRAQELRHAVDKAAAGSGVVLRVLADVDSLTTILLAVQKGFTSTILPSSALTALGDHRLILRSLAPKLKRTLSVCRLRSTPVTPASAAVHAELVALATCTVQSGQWKGAKLFADESASGKARDVESIA